MERAGPGFSQVCFHQATVNTVFFLGHLMPEWLPLSPQCDPCRSFSSLQDPLTQEWSSWPGNNFCFDPVIGLSLHHTLCGPNAFGPPWPLQPPFPFPKSSLFSPGLPEGNWKTGGHATVFIMLHACSQSCPALCNPMDCSPPASSVRRIFQARIQKPVAISYSRGSSRPRNQTHVSYMSLALQADSLPLTSNEPTGSH